MTDKNPAQAGKASEYFEYHLLHLFDVSAAEAHSKGNNDETANEKYRKQRQALIAYVARLEARQMHPDFDEMYALYLRDEKRGDPALRDVRFAGYAAAFFTRFLRIMNPDWANEEGEE